LRVSGTPKLATLFFLFPFDGRAGLVYSLGMKKTIEFFQKEVYGNSLEYIANESDAKIISQLTGKKTITSVERELIRDLSGGLVNFKQILPPSNLK
jgi:hypothetical protein